MHSPLSEYSDINRLTPPVYVIVYVDSLKEEVAGPIRHRLNFFYSNETNIAFYDRTDFCGSNEMTWLDFLKFPDNFFGQLVMQNVVLDSTLL